MNVKDYRAFEEINGYVDDVLSEKVVACVAIRSACQRFRDDLERSKSDDYAFYFDAKHAEDVCVFFPTMIRHSIGKYEGTPFYLQPWQAFAIANIFGWKNKKTNCRRFTKAYVSVARKNGKSCLASAICIFAAGFDRNPIAGGFESIAQVVLAASKKEQADRVTMAECIRMRSQSAEISKLSRFKNKQILFDHNGGHIITVGSDRAFDGLSPRVVQIDEMHAFRSSGNQKEFIDTMKTGSGARAQPLYLVTTTAGSTSSELWKSEWTYASAVVRGEIRDESYFTLSYELDEEDDPLEEDVWIKANPSLGVTLDIEYLRDQVKPAKTDGVSLNRFTRYHGNRLVSNLDSAFDLEQWDNCQGELSDWRDADAVTGGIDLGARDDLAALAFVARYLTGDEREAEDGEPNPIYRYEARVFSYLASDTVRDVSRKPFVDFIADGLIKQSKYPLSQLEGDAVREGENYGCVELAIDPYQAQATGERLESEGLTIATMPQGTRHFNEPICELRQAIADGRFTHDGNPLLRWCMGNAVLVTDRNDRVMYSKADSTEKIDACVAMTMAFGRSVHAESRSESFFTY